jgi:hypothetical protein
MVARRKPVPRTIPSPFVWLALSILALVALPRVSAAQAAGESPATTPVQFALWHPIQVFGEGVSVAGLRLSVISGANRDVVGLDLSGIVALTRGNQVGQQVSLYNGVDGDVTGWQVGVLANDVDGRVRGLQTAVAYNQAGDGIGVQLAVGLNRTKHTRGLQVSLVNWTDQLDGAQIGLINVNRGGPIPFLPFFNVGF